jgi:hypothetical protein
MPPSSPPEPDHNAPRPPRRVPSSAIASFIDEARIDALLAPWVVDPEERAFVLRCLLREGPAHHRGANYILIALLGRLLEATGGPPTPIPGPHRPVPLRLPPHLAEAGDENGVFPLPLPTAALEALAPAGSPAMEAMVDCLADGPPQHSLANAAMLCLLTALLERAEPRAG